MLPVVKINGNQLGNFFIHHCFAYVLENYLRVDLFRATSLPLAVRRYEPIVKVTFPSDRVAVVCEKSWKNRFFFSRSGNCASSLGILNSISKLVESLYFLASHWIWKGDPFMNFVSEYSCKELLTPVAY